MIFPVVTRTATQLQSMFLTVLPHGGQGAARRNAWTAMSRDVAHSRARREAEVAVHRAVVRSARATS